MDLHNETNANGFEKLLCNGINQVEVRDKYILPPHERPNMSQVSYSESIPVVDLKQLGGPNRSTVIQQIRRACEEDGFFQVQPSILSAELINTFAFQVEYEYG
jgi:hypothetical protein